jgi:folate-binding Fe-S cluster repair protein YgfZ
MDPYAAMTEGVALVDRSESGKLALTGAEAKTFLNGQVSNEIEALEPGTGCYAALLTPKGKMLADLRVLDVGPPTTSCCSCASARRSRRSSTRCDASTSASTRSCTSARCSSGSSH